MRRSLLQTVPWVVGSLLAAFAVVYMGIPPGHDLFPVTVAAWAIVYAGAAGGFK